MVWLQQSFELMNKLLNSLEYNETNNKKVMRGLILVIKAFLLSFLAHRPQLSQKLFLSTKNALLVILSSIINKLPRLYIITSLTLLRVSHWWLWSSPMVNKEAQLLSLRRQTANLRIICICLSVCEGNDSQPDGTQRCKTQKKQTSMIVKRFQAGAH